jgi:hypothetical protein
MELILPAAEVVEVVENHLAHQLRQMVVQE